MTNSKNPKSEIGATQSAEFNSLLTEIGASAKLSQLADWIERTALSADAKAILMDLTRLTFKVGEKVVQIGRYLLTTAFDLLRNHPNTAFGAIIGLILSTVIGAVPIFGPMLAAMLTPLMVATGIAAGAMADMLSAPARVRIRETETRLAAFNSFGVVNG